MGDDRPEPQRTGRTTGSSVLTPPTGIRVIPDVPDHAESLLEPLRNADAVVPCAEPVPARVVPIGVWIPPDVDALAGSCLCGHGSPAHEHWRRGSDCGVCGAASCPAFRRRGGRVRRLLRRLGLVR